MNTVVRVPRVVRSQAAVAGGRMAGVRLVTAFPAVGASGLLLILLWAPLGWWASLVVAGWLAVAPALHTRVGERVAVAVGCRFRELRPVDRAALGPVWLSACRIAGIAVTDVDLYVKRDGGVNAYAAGQRSVAVTTGALMALSAGSLSPSGMRALLLHELGHHAVSGLRYRLAAAWLAWPWRLARRLVLGLCLPVARRQPRALLVAVVAAGLVVAVAQSVQQRRLAGAVLIATVALCAAACPVLDAWADRWAELAADRFAASCGAGPDLAVVLSRVDTAAGTRHSPLPVLRRHPPLARRLAVLAQTPIKVRGPAGRPTVDGGAAG